VTAAFRAGGVPVGSFSARGRPMWVSVAVRGLAVSGLVTCQLVDHNGAERTLGLFDLVEGAGTWATPDPPGIGRDQQAPLIDGSGRVPSIRHMVMTGISIGDRCFRPANPPWWAHLVGGWGVAHHRWIDMLASSTPGRRACFVQVGQTLRSCAGMALTRRRYQHVRLAGISNQPFRSWAQFFGGVSIAAATIVRPVYHTEPVSSRDDNRLTKRSSTWAGWLPTSTLATGGKVGPVNLAGAVRTRTAVAFPTVRS
jgi:hypothetical protein